VPMVDENGGMLNDPVLLKIAEDKYWNTKKSWDIWSKRITAWY